MFLKILRAGRPSTIVLLSTILAVAGSAHYTRANHPPSRGALKAELVKTGLYLISGGGCNSLLRLSASGLIIVDGKLPGNYDELLEQAHKISDQPVRVLINTDYHENHTEQFQVPGRRYSDPGAGKCKRKSDYLQYGGRKSGIADQDL